MDLSNRFILVKALGGSHSYGLSTPASDLDYRGVFVNTKASHLVGLRRDEVFVEKDLDDEVFYEFRHALKLLKSANTQIVELLFMDEYLEVSDDWKLLIERRLELIDSERLFSGLRGYMQGELKLANGERTGRLGGKRKEALDKYGYSPKNFVQLLRLAYAGTTYFSVRHFPVNVVKYNPSFGNWLLDVKTHPEKYTKEQLNKAAETAEKFMIEVYEINKEKNTSFNEELANQLCLNVYRKWINKL
jgi:uncharacterized protein